MTRDEKFKIRRRTTRRELWNRVAEIPNLPIKSALLAAYLLGAVYVQGKQETVDVFMETLILPAPLVEAICDNLLRSYLLAGVIVFVILLIYPFDRKMVEDQFQSIGLANTAGLVPKLLRKRRDKDHPRVTIWEFNSQISLEEMLNYLDIYPITLPARYNDKVACYTKVYITSNQPLEKQYRNEQWDRYDSWLAFLRRVHNVVELMPDGTLRTIKQKGVPNHDKR